MLSNTKLGAMIGGARSNAALLGSLSLCASVALTLAFGCSSDASTKPPGSQAAVSVGCGNGVIDGTEVCDGADLAGATCMSATMGAFPIGDLKCANTCDQLDESGCTAAPTGGGGGAPSVPPPGTQPPGTAGSTVMPPSMMPGTGGGPSSSDGGSTGIAPIGGGGATSGGGSTSTSQGGAAPAGNVDPVIPQVSGDCPMWTNATITYMGLGGIQIAAGAKPAGPTAPMLVYWHGTGSTSGEYAFMAAPVANGVTQAGGVIVSFQNTTGGDLYSGTNIFGVGDLKLVDQLVACAVRDHNIDPRRIYTMGCSAGGLFSTAMAAMRSSYIAAAAPNSGGEVVGAMFDSKHIPPLMTVHGAMGSDVVIVDFSQTSATADMAFKQAGGFVIDCNTGGGHCGGAGLAGDAWTFFQAHPFGVDPEPWTGGLPSGFSSQCKIQ